MDSNLWVTTGHMQAYRDMMFLTEKRAATSASTRSSR